MMKNKYIEIGVKIKNNIKYKTYINYIINGSYRISFRSIKSNG